MAAGQKRLVQLRKVGRDVIWGLVQSCRLGIYEMYHPSIRSSSFIFISTLGTGHKTAVYVIF